MFPCEWRLHHGADAACLAFVFSVTAFVGDGKTFCGAGAVVLVVMHKESCTFIELFLKSDMVIQAGDLVNAG